MGTYTTNLKLYKPDASEFVDVDVQLNRNWDIADEAVRRLLEYEFTPLAFPDMSEALTPRAKFFKPYSNSIVTYFKLNNTWYQDPTANVAPWVHVSALYNEGYFESDDLPVYYRIVKNAGGSTTKIEWCGAIWELGGAMELNTNVVVIPVGGLPTSVRPTVSKYWNVWAGNTGADFSMARILIGNDGRLEFKRYGVNPGSGSAENRIEFTGITYNLEVTG